MIDPLWSVAAVAASLGVVIFASIHHGGGPAFAATPTPAPARDASAVAVVDAGLPSPRCPEGMAFIPAGEFMMGAEGDAGSAGRRVRLSAFCIDRTEVTVAAYRACANRGECPAPPATVQLSRDARGSHRDSDRWCNGGRTDRNTHPMNCVDWTSANRFCRATGAQLPTEAQWEYAARGFDGRLYPWGNQPPDETRLNACGGECVALMQREMGELWVAMYPGNDGWESTAPVGSYAAGRSPFGVFDMAGNVDEWTSDWHGALSSNQGAPALDPTGPASGTWRTFRGGNWYCSDPPGVRALRRGMGSVSDRSEDLGFRCAHGVIATH